MGEKWTDILMGEVLERVVKASGWKKNGKANRGWGMALYDRGTPEGKASSALTLEADGKVNILTRSSRCRSRLLYCQSADGLREAWAAAGESWRSFQRHR